MRELKKGSLGMLILHLLQERPGYGYDLCARLRERSEGVLAFEDAAVYPLLHEYERRGLLEGYWDADHVFPGDHVSGASGVEARKGPRRRYYRVTPAGCAALRANIEEWAAFSQGVTRILGDANARLAHE